MKKIVSSADLINKNFVPDLAELDYFAGLTLGQKEKYILERIAAECPKKSSVSKPRPSK